MDSTISTLKASNPTLKSALKSATAKLATLKSAPTKTELETTIYNLTSENKVKKEKLDAFLNGRVSQVSKEDVGKVEKEYKYWAVKKRERKRAYEGLEDLLMGGMTREEIREKCGVESDEE
jgi:26S proteasome regulatory subunit (ATPase 3-interacting protein)